MWILLDILWILLVLIPMVSCGAHSSWAGTTDGQGLNQHCATCSFFKRSSIVASQRRLQWARDATLANFDRSESWSGNMSQRIFPVRSNTTHTSFDGPNLVASELQPHLFHTSDLETRAMDREGLDSGDGFDHIHHSTVSEEPTLPPRRHFPRSFNNIEHSAEDLDGSHQKSETEVQRLVREVLQADDFNVKHLDGFLVKRNENGRKVNFPDDWVESTITIDIPTKSKEEASKAYTVASFHYQPLIDVIHAAFADVQAGTFHLFPFKWLWRDPLDNHQE
ncbi:uncharacterized protein BJ212DRAFT_1297417 [Suillus subaureus]|uniref:Uncharacterized protein n=1 Tax=Suillus subaureus TaxID=48587 RepID=A0A9P7EHC8_9AGAM|nr:uncharacterized protein BJ212DRAFT_1297417 [Suillus subaureus]KAG1820940.1 hypothetical protein BJ212DRAFT_1297417 [Suillus subaureus]